MMTMCWLIIGLSYNIITISIVTSRHVCHVYPAIDNNTAIAPPLKPYYKDKAKSMDKIDPLHTRLKNRLFHRSSPLSPSSSSQQEKHRSRLQQSQSQSQSQSQPESQSQSQPQVQSQSDTTNQKQKEQAGGPGTERVKYAKGEHDGSAAAMGMGFNPPLFVKCGPLLRFTGIDKVKVSTNKGGGGKRRRRGDGSGSGSDSDGGVWKGSIMIVTDDERSVYEPVPAVRVCITGMDEHGNGHAGKSDGEELSTGMGELIKLSSTGKALGIKPESDIERGVDYSTGQGSLFYKLHQPHPNTAHPNPTHPDNEQDPKTKTQVNAIRLHTERNVTFWRFNLSIPQSTSQSVVHYSINNAPALTFYIPGVNENAHIMFHSCNGFSLGVDTRSYSGPDPLWRDVLRTHTTPTKSFHVMIGGGDQIYNDESRLQTPHFHRWTEETKNILRKRRAPFTTAMKSELEAFYLERYTWWFSHGLFSVATAHIPMINIWDDHDIIDGYGSYPRRTMESPVFRGLGAVACKYYLLFQHQSLPMSMVLDNEENTDDVEDSWVLGQNAGPYIDEVSRSLFVRLGARMAFLGVDCRMERTRYQVMEKQSWDILLGRCREEIVRGETRHLVVLLGIPIIYPRLTALEILFSSKAMTPLKALGRAGLFGPLFNKFDGGIELLDDLDDHWTTRHHRREREFFVHELQKLAREKGVRVSVLSGDVHLAAVGAFRTSPTPEPSFMTRYKRKSRSRSISKHKAKAEDILSEQSDPNYIPNIISSAITNRPPARAVANILNRCDRVHFLDERTEERMVPVFGEDVDGRRRYNTHLMARRNWCDIAEVANEFLNGVADGTADGVDGVDGTAEMDGDADGQGKKEKEKGGEKGEKSDLRVQLRIEMDEGDPAGWTKGYELIVPGLV